jgi:hypothetical protein
MDHEAVEQEVAFAHRFSGRTSWALIEAGFLQEISFSEKKSSSDIETHGDIGDDLPVFVVDVGLLIRLMSLKRNPS